MKRIIPFLIAVTMMLLLIPFGSVASAATEDLTATLSVENVSAAIDSYVDVAINITENPGIVSMGLTLTFDEDLTLVGAANGEAFAELNMTPPAQLKKQGSVTGSCRFAWLGSDDCTEIGTILVLTFKVSADAEMYKDCQITVSCDEGDILDNSRNPIELIANPGKVTIIDYVPGDVDESGAINMLDVLTLCQYYVDGCKYDPDGYAIDLKAESGDVDANGKINMLDILTICQYYVDGCKYDPNGYGIKLLPGKRTCQHNMQYFADKTATCEEDGNIEYWHCSKCNKYFSDTEAKQEILFANTILNATGHTYATSWFYDEYAHWHIATCEHSSEIKDYAEHTFVDHQCSVCGISETYNQQFTVKFVDFDNSIIDIQSVDYGCDATKPSDPIRKNYTFVGWDTTYTSVVSDLTVKAQYVRQYTVTFVDYDGAVIATEVVNRGDNAPPPAIPNREGYTFTSWNQSYNNVVSDLEIMAVYKINRYTVTFLNADGSVLSTVSNVAHGATVTPPKTTDIYFDWSKTKGYRFTGWKNWDETQQIVGNIAITADYSEEITEPIIAIETKEISKGTTTAEVSVYLCGYFEDVYGMNLKVHYAEQLFLNNASVVVNSKLGGSESILNTEKYLYELSWVDGQGIDIDERIKVLTLTFNIDKYTAVGEYLIDLLEESSYIIDGNLLKNTPVIVVGYIKITE